MPASDAQSGRKGQSNLYIVGFAAAVCGVCSIAVSASAVALKARQEENKVVDRLRNVLVVTGLVEPGASPTTAEIQQTFDDNVEARIVRLQTGEYVEGIKATAYDPRKAMADPKTSRAAPVNAAKVRRLPLDGLVYLLKRGDAVDTVVLPVRGKGLWSTLHGYLALDRDTTTIRGITFYEHGETPGLGGEVDNPRWKQVWVNRKAFDTSWQPAITVIKGAAQPIDAAPHHIDGLSGATLTARGVTHLVQFWLGEHGYGPYLARLRAGSEG